MAKKVTFSLDGKTVEAEEGALVIEVAKANGIEIPHYCYHEALGNPGTCRLCICEVEGAPKPMVSCRLPAREGLVVKTNSPTARRAQASSLEFHLANHPLDCPVCDQAGECFLQDYYQKFGLYTSSVREDKHHKPKRVDIGGHVMLDAERCILCTRCVRFLDKITGTGELGIFERGDRSVLAPYPGKRVDNPYSGNIVDICPVGALTDKDFRFSVRVWYLERSPSVCTGCSRGCSIEVHANNKRRWHASGRRAARLKPRFNPEVNGHWMCDEGRYSYKAIDAKTRLSAVSALREGAPRKASWDEALGSIAGELREACRVKGSQGLAVVLSATLSNEDLFAAKLLFVDTLKAGQLLLAPGPDQLGEEDQLLRKKEKVPNLRGAQAMGFGAAIEESSWEKIREGAGRGAIWGLWIVDRDPVAVWGKTAAAAALKPLSFSLYQGSQSNHFVQEARWALPSCSFAEEESTFTNFEGQVQRTAQAFPPLGEARADWEIFGGVLKALGEPFPFESARSVFAALCSKEKAFAGLDWEGLGEFGKRLGGK